MKLYLLVRYHPQSAEELDVLPPQWKLGGGSSTKPAARIYDNRLQAERYAKGYGAEIVEIEV